MSKIKEISNIQRATLEQLCDLFNENKIAAKLFDKENDTDTDVLSVILSDYSDAALEVNAEFSFYNQEIIGDDVQYLNCLLELSDPIDEEYVHDVEAVCAILNAKLPSGAYCVDYDTKALIFRLSAPLITTLSKETMLEQSDSVITNSITIASEYAAMLTDVVNGKKSFVDFISVK